MITDEDAKVNQEAIDLMYEYFDSNSKNYYADAKEVLKYLFNRGYKVTKI